MEIADCMISDNGGKATIVEAKRKFPIKLGGSEAGYIPVNGSIYVHVRIGL
jgi:hypothetical protein